jgi:hypothetical protein
LYPHIIRCLNCCRCLMTMDRVKAPKKGFNPACISKDWVVTKYSTRQNHQLKTAATGRSKIRKYSSSRHKKYNRRLHPRNPILIQPHPYFPSLSTSRRMIRLINLHSTFHRLDHPKEEGHPNNQCYSQPKIIPLHRLPSVTPPTLESPWFCFVEDLLEDDETVPPEVEVLNLTSFCG